MLIFPERMKEDGLFHQHGIREVSAKRAAEQEDGFACLTSLVAELKLNWDLFRCGRTIGDDPYFGPPGKRTYSIRNWNRGRATAPKQSCWSYQYDNVLESDRYSIQWEDNAIDQDEAEGFLDSLEYSWDVEIDDLGWNAPPAPTTIR